MTTTHKPHYLKGDTSAATEAMRKIRERERLRVPRDLVLSDDKFLECCGARWNSQNSVSITALICGDPCHGRSALDGWQQTGIIDPNNLNRRSKRRQPPYLSK